MAVYSLFTHLYTLRRVKWQHILSLLTSILSGELNGNILLYTLLYYHESKMATYSLITHFCTLRRVKWQHLFSLHTSILSGELNGNISLHTSIHSGELIGSVFFLYSLLYSQES